MPSLSLSSFLLISLAESKRKLGSREVRGQVHGGQSPRAQKDLERPKKIPSTLNPSTKEELASRVYPTVDVPEGNQMTKVIKKVTVSVGESAEKSDPTDTAGGSVEWCGHCGRQSGGS